MTPAFHLFNSNRSSLNLQHYLCLSHYTTTTPPSIAKQFQEHHRHQQNQTNPLLSSLERKSHQRLISLIKSCTQKSHLLQIHGHLIRNSLLHYPAISLPFLSGMALSPIRDISYSRQFFSQIPNPSVFLYNTLIRAYSMSNSPIEGFFMYQEMRKNGLRADPVTLSFVIKCYIRVSSLIGGEQVHARILSDGHQFDSLLLTNLMDLYSLCDKGSEACKVFDEMRQRDTIAWNVLISCYMRNRRTRDVLVIFDGMLSGELGCEPDDVTCLLLLQACSNLGALEFGEKVHRHIVERGYDNATNLCNSLIAMYSQFGNLDKAFGVFKGMHNKNVVTWSAIISGLAMNGYGREAIGAFEEMLKMGVLPDDQTFTGVLSACSNCELVEKGMIIFARMSKEFGIVPNIHHYGCMVDLLGRAGQLHQAYQLIMSMRVKPDSTIWRTLLGACRIHRNVILGEHVVEHLIELKAQEAGDYILLFNLYSSVDNWKKVTELKKFMKEKGIQTTPASSSIELKGKVHEFVVDDVSHPQKDEIYEMLDEISKQLKIAGYVAEIISELPNLDAEEKRYVHSYHSEKLAIAFGVLATPPGTTIRIAKNLRICVDCHNFAKILSGVYNRQVIITDHTRFHHFRGGHCSCSDDW
ncbi:PREDICTED: pentatricopeptide repeat-containing protein At3g47530 [Populus euphratica]|uniref:Pentatricopeptide repeat-containing protein At3g47530 n=1 Tax=Populus euphratica TaxID=75702 RepID=A0AAJ6XUT9_POPEU|nr:PREDICTED: pentatricopeptide repeat-containing protein At3g47530 [Populus euphratica]